jgi:hypothetical protein
MSPTSTPRATARKVALCAAALVVTILPAACGSAYADSTRGGGHAGHHSSGSTVDGDDVVKVGESRDDDAPADDGEEATPGGAEDDNPDQDGDQRADQGADEAAERAAAAQNRQDGQNRQEQPPAEEEPGADDAAADNGLDVLGTDCTNSELEAHDGFQEAPRCVSTSFGEVASEDQSPSLLITEAPGTVRAQEEFTITVSTRNLVRDRFLGAAAGGYYLESSFLNEDGIQRGHFHTACRTLDDLDTAPNAEPEPEFFLATQDNGGGAAPDTVKVTVSGMPRPGTVQCAVWAGDGSHRVPMMQRADQTPAFDAVRITVE